MTTILSEKFADLYYDEQTPCFIIDWKGFQKMESVKPFCEKITKILEEKRKENPNLTAFIGNTLKLEVLSESIQNYWNEEWNPAMYEAGGRFLAVIVPSNVFAQFSVDKYVDSAKDNMKEIQVRFFDDVDNAKEWLVTCQTAN